jgi:hypothetical protein
LFQNNEKVFIKAYEKATADKSKLPGLENYLMHYLEPSIMTIKADYREHILTCIVLENCKKDLFLHELPRLWNDFISGEETGRNGKFN